MKSKIALITLALFTGQASAEWELIGGTDKSSVSIDRSTIRKQNGFTLAWFLENYDVTMKSQSGKSYRSVKELYAFNCDELVYGIKSYSYHSGLSGTGEVVLNFTDKWPELEFLDVSPGSVGEAKLKAVCGIN